MKAQTKAVVASVVVIALALTAVSGITYSWFSDSERADVDVDTATVRYDVTFTALAEKGEGNIVKNADTDSFKLSNLAAGQQYSIGIAIDNLSSITTAYRIYVVYERSEDSKIVDYDLKNIFINGKCLFGNDEIVVKSWATLDKFSNPDQYTVLITTPTTYGDESAPSDWDNKTAKSGLKISVIVEAYQSSYLSAEVDGMLYPTVGEAIAAAESGKTITLISDARESIVIDGKEIILDLNGKSITAATPNSSAIKVTNGGTLTINGDGRVDGGSGGNNVGVWANNGTVIINGGEYTVGPDASGSGNTVIYSTGGDITINSGFFYTDSIYDGRHYVLNQNNDHPGQISVTGGTFVDYNPATGDDYLGGNFVDSDYNVIEEVNI